MEWNQNKSIWFAPFLSLYNNDKSNNRKISGICVTGSKNYKIYLGTKIQRHKKEKEKESIDRVFKCAYQFLKTKGERHTSLNVPFYKYTDSFV